MSEFRFCKLNQEWVLFAPKRASRPHNKSNKPLYTPIEDCPFENSNDKFITSEIARVGDGNNWRCKVIPNLYNALTIEIEPYSQRDMFYDKFSGFGAHEVIIETPIHERNMYSFNQSEFEDYLKLLRIRYIELKKDSRIKYVSIFKNSGEDAGATMSHAHSQLMATPFLPPMIEKSLKHQKAYYEEKKRSLFDDLVYEEVNLKRGIIFENDSFIAYAPYASKFAFEVMIVPKGEISSIEDLNSVEHKQLAQIMELVYTRLHITLGDFSYNMVMNNAPYIKDDNLKKYYKFYINIIPRLFKIAGFELSSNIHVNTVLPESVAETLREI